MSNSITREILDRELSKEVPSDEFGVLIYGAGNNSELYQKCLDKENIEPSFYVDKSTDKIGTSFHGVPIISPEEMVSAHREKLVLISTINGMYNDEITEYCVSNGMRCCRIDEYVFHKRKNDILDVFDMLDDDESRNVYGNMILIRMGRTKFNNGILSPHSQQYFAISEFEKRDENEVFVDCGAYVGDTLESYIWNRYGIFSGIYAFEPDERNYKALEFRKERLLKEWAIPDNKIITTKAAVGLKSCVAGIYNTVSESANLSAIITENDSEDGSNEKICVVSLDEYFEKQKVSFIKADIESYEYDMLLGAKKIIIRDRPKIAVCIYHNATDMYSVAKLLKSYHKDYKLYVRQHYCAMSETVLYAL